MKRISAAQRMKMQATQAAMNEGMAVIIAAQVKWKQGKISIEEAMEQITVVVDEIGKEVLGDVTWRQLVEGEAEPL